MSEAKKVIIWASNQSNGHGGHIGALSEAIERGDFDQDTADQLNKTLSEWVAEHEARFSA